MYYRNFRLWGWKGVWHFVPQLMEKRRIRKRILHHVNERTIPKRGITLIGGFSDKTSLSKVFRDLAFRLKEAGIPFQAFDPNPAHEVPEGEYMSIITPEAEVDLFKYSHVIDNIVGPVSIDFPSSIKHASIAFWEFDSGLIEGYPHILNVKNVIAMSDFNAEYFRKALPFSIGVHKILYPFRFNPGQLGDPQAVRRRYGFSADEFIVFFNFALGTARKNPEGALRAFAKAFRDTPQTRLVFKTMVTMKCAEEIDMFRNIANTEGIADRFTIIDTYLNITELYSLTNACNVYLSLHRGEGFGLGVAEAMSLSKPVVVTDYSSTTEFCSDKNSMPIPFKIVQMTNHQPHLPCKGVKTWAEPDINEAAIALKRLHASVKLQKTIGKQAQDTIISHFSISEFQKSITRFLAT